MKPLNKENFQVKLFNNKEPFKIKFFIRKKSQTLHSQGTNIKNKSI